MENPPPCSVRAWLAAAWMAPALLPGTGARIWTMAGLEPSWVGIRVELEMTHSLVSGDTYGRAW